MAKKSKPVSLGGEGAAEDIRVPYGKRRSELAKIAEEKGIAGFARMTKAELEEALDMVPQPYVHKPGDPLDA